MPSLTILKYYIFIAVNITNEYEVNQFSFVGLMDWVEHRCRFTKVTGLIIVIIKNGLETQLVFVLSFCSP